MWIKCLTIGVLIALALMFGRLTSAPLAGGPRILELQLAPTEERANAFLREWKARDNWRERLKLSLDWDTWLICAYAPLFALLCWIASSHLAPTMPRLAAAGWVLAVLQLLAGVLDFIENAAVGKMIDAGSARQPWPLVTFAAAGTKWLLIAAFLLFGAFALGHWLWGLRR
jgi:hypothetical protein